MLRGLRAALLLAWLPAPVAGQLLVSGTRDLAFGGLFTAVPVTVPPDDPVKSGIFDIVASKGDRLRIRLTLPSSLTGPGGTLSISFQNSSAMVIVPGSPPEAFNPQGNQNIRLETSDRAQVFLGGRVTPSGSQPTGPYANTVVITVTVM